MTSHRPRRLPVWLSSRTGAVAALAAGLLLTGCSATNPIETIANYHASDGVGVSLGDVRADNLLILSAGLGDPGVLYGAFTNNGEQDVTLTVAFSAVGAEAGVAPTADPATIEIAAGETVLISDATGASELNIPNERITVTATPAAPGELALVALGSDVAGTTTLQVPVLDGTLPDYASLVPTPQG